MMNQKKYALKTRYEEQRDLERDKQNQKLKNQQTVKFNNFGFYDFLFFFIIIIVSVLWKILDINFQ